jgi:hypothetical protein
MWDLDPPLRSPRQGEAGATRSAFLRADRARRRSSLAPIAATDGPYSVASCPPAERVPYLPAERSER